MKSDRPSRHEGCSSDEVLIRTPDDIHEDSVGDVAARSFSGLELRPNKTVDGDIGATIGKKSRSQSVHRGQSSTVYRCYEADIDPTDEGTSASSCAVKVLNELHPTDNRVARFMHEYDVSKSLSECPAVRGAVKKGVVGGSPAIYFHWANGVTVREWVHKARSNSKAAQKEDGIRSPLRLATATARALSQIHECGVIHNKLTADSIVVDEDGGAFSVKIIDLSLATHDGDSAMNFGGFSLKEAADPNIVGAAHTLEGKQVDLHCLGIVLYEIFTHGVNPFHKHEGDDNSISSISMFSEGTSADGTTKRKKGKMQRSKSSARHSPGRPVGKGESDNVSACSCSSNSEGTSIEELPKSKRKSLRFRSCVPPSQYGVPAYIGSIIMSLLEAGSDQYRNAKQVEDDLQLMLDEPARFSLDNDAEWLRGHLHIRNDRLYGRKAEMSMLMYSYHRVINMGGSCEMALVSGLPGTGKTMLIRQVRPPLIDAGGFFVEGKFDQYKQSEPLSAVLVALNDFCERMMHEPNAEQTSEILADVQAEIGTYSSVLAALIPNFGKMIGVEPNDYISATMGGKQALRRLDFLTRKFVLALSSPSHPIIFFLDDLQWADEASLRWIRMLVSDPEIRSLLFVGSFRDNEVSSAHPLTATLQKIYLAGVRVTNIKLSNSIGVDGVNALISESLCLPPRLTRALATAVHVKTEGVALFVVQFLRSLHDGGELWFSVRSRRWEWDLQPIKSKDVADNVVDLTIKRVQSLPREVLSVLKTAACLGFQFDAAILDCAKKDGGVDTLACLDVAIDEGFIEKVGTKYIFVHDQVHQATYRLLPPFKRDLFHFRLGMLLYMQAPQEQLDKVAQIAANQINRGAPAIAMDSEQRLELAKINMRAGEVAMASSSFVSAATYLKAGVSFLRENHWEQNYSLCLQLFDAAAEAAYIAGDASAVQDLLSQTLSHAQCFEDKLNAYRTFVNSVTASDDLRAAVGKGFEVLARLGEAFPTEIDQSVIKRELSTTMRMMEGMNEDKVFNLPEMTDSRKLAAMRFLNLMTFSAFSFKPSLNILVVFRMVQLSLQYGVCKVSPIGFAGVGQFLISDRGGSDIEYGYQLGKMALSLLERLGAREYTARVCCLVFGFIKIWKEPLQSCLEPHRFAHEAGMASGDIEYAMVNLQYYCVSSFMSGISLQLLEKEVRTFSDQMLDCMQHGLLRLMLSLHLSILTLMGQSEDAIILDGETVTEVKLLAELEATEQVGFCRGVYFMRMYVAFLFKEYDQAIEMLRKWQGSEGGTHTRFNVCVATFFEGMIAFKFARETNEEKWRAVGERAIGKMKLWAKHSSWNCMNKLRLLEAESFFLQKDTEKASALYDAAVNVARDHRFIHEQAIACERAGEFFGEFVGDRARSLEYFRRSQQCYSEWGCHAKVELLRSHLVVLERG